MPDECLHCVIMELAIKKQLGGKIIDDWDEDKFNYVVSSIGQALSELFGSWFANDSKKDLIKFVVCYADWIAKKSLQERDEVRERSAKLQMSEHLARIVAEHKHE